MPVEVEFTSVLEAAPDVVWDRVVRVTGANDELWPFAKMTAPSFADRLTGPGNGRLPYFAAGFFSSVWSPSIAGRFSSRCSTRAG